MARLGTGYAGTFNRRHRRVGHLLQNRYQSRIVENDRDLLGLVRYIHCNPLHAGLVPSAETLGGFPWCGHGALTGERPARPFEASRAVLCLLAEEPSEARRQLCHWMRQSPDSTDLASGPLERAPAPRHWQDAASLEALALKELTQAVCTAHGLPPEALGSRRRSRPVLEARSELVRRAIRDLGLPSRAVARALGVSDSTVSRALERSDEGGRDDT
jgi:putative transposase